MSVFLEGETSLKPAGIPSGLVMINLWAFGMILTNSKHPLPACYRSYPGSTIKPGGFAFSIRLTNRVSKWNHMVLPFLELMRLAINYRAWMAKKPYAYRVNVVCELMPASQWKQLCLFVCLKITCQISAAVHQATDWPEIDNQEDLCGLGAERQHGSAADFAAPSAAGTAQSRPNPVERCGLAARTVVWLNCQHTCHRTPNCTFASQIW